MFAFLECKLSPASSLYATLLIFSGMVAAVVAYIAWQRRHSTGGKPLLWMMIAMVVWTWTYALHWISPYWPLPFFWLDCTYFGVVSVPGLIFCFSVQTFLQDRRFSKKYWVLLLIEPLLTLILLWSDPYHHLFFGNFRLSDTSDIFSGGPWFWANVIYSYLLLLAAFYFFVSAYVKSQGAIYRKQVGICLIGSSILFVVNASGVLGFHPLPGLDLTPILFTITGLSFVISLLSYRMLDLVPVARDVLLDQMQDGMIVMDDLGRIIDINQAASRLINNSINVLTGKKLEESIAAIPELKEALLPAIPGSMQVRIKGIMDRVLDIQTIPLQPSFSSTRGFLISWRDITQLKQTETDLRRANEALSVNLDEINQLRKSLEAQVIRDPLTGLFNRRFLENVLAGEVCPRRKAENADQYFDDRHR